MTSIIDRLTALEATIAELKAENEVLKMLTPLEAFTAGLKDASAEQVQAWAEACAEVAEAHGVSGETKAKKVGKAKTSEPKQKKETTNAEGPSEWNVFVQATWHEMAALKGIVGEHNDAFKKACKEAGVRKAALEGREVGEKKPKAKPVAEPKKAKTAAPKAKAKASGGGGGGGPGPAPSAPPALRKPTAEEIAEATPESDETMRAAMTAEGEESGWQAVFLNGQACWLKDDGEVVEYSCNQTLGVYSDGEFAPMD